jgi:hypothetical protein
MEIEVIVGLISSLIIPILYVYGFLKREKEKKIKMEDNCRNVLMLFSETLENIINIINKFYPTDNIIELRFEVAIFILYTLGDHDPLSARWFRDNIITYISNNIKHFTREDYEQRWSFYHTNSVNIEKKTYDYYKKFDMLFLLIKKHIKNGVQRKLFRNKNSRKAYLPIDGISKEIWKLEKIMDA